MKISLRLPHFERFRREIGKLTLDKTLKLSIIVGILAVSVAVVYHFMIRPELTQRRSEGLFRECLLNAAAALADLEGGTTQEEQEWLIEVCVRSGGIKEADKFEWWTDNNPLEGLR